MVWFLAAQVYAFGKILTPKGPVTLRCRTMLFLVDAGSDFSTFQALLLITATQITISYISPLRTKLQILHKCSDIGMADSCLHFNDGKTEVLVCAPDTFVVGR